MKKIDEVFAYALPKPKEERESWFEARRGKFTASRLDDLMKTGRGKDERFGQAAIKYIYEIIHAKLTGQDHQVTSASLEWGIDNESDARILYENKTGRVVKYPSFIEFNSFSGGTPDGITDDGGIIEIKCPFNGANHIQCVLENEVPKQYEFQVQGNLLFTGAKYCDFISYDPRCEDPLNIQIIRVEPDKEVHELIRSRLEEAREKMIEMLAELKERS